MDQFIKKDPNLYWKIRFLDIYMAGHNGYIAGGCFKNIFLGAKIKDIDIFFENEIDFTSAKLMFEESEDYILSYENKNTVAFKNKKTNIRVELIRSQFGKPGEVLSKFDFSIVKFAYYKERSENDLGETAVSFMCLHHSDFFEHLTLKKLILNKDILFPVSTFERSLRYYKYGFGLCRESKQNLLESIKNVETIDVSNDLYFGFD